MFTFSWNWYDEYFITCIHVIITHMLNVIYHHQPGVSHCWSKPSPLHLQSDLFCSSLLHSYPSLSTIASRHLALGRSALLLPYSGCHSLHYLAVKMTYFTFVLCIINMFVFFFLVLTASTYPFCGTLCFVEFLLHHLCECPCFTYIGHCWQNTLIEDTLIKKDSGFGFWVYLFDDDGVCPLNPLLLQRLHRSFWFSYNFFVILLIMILAKSLYEWDRRLISLYVFGFFASTFYVEDDDVRLLPE